MSITLAKAINRLGFLIKEPTGSITAYSTGTVTVSASVTVTGSGTTWLTDIKAGDTFHISAGKYYSVLSIESNTSLTLVEAYAGTAGSGLSYTIKDGRRPDAMKVDDLNNAQRQIVNKIHSYDENYFATTGTISYQSGTELYAFPTTNGVIRKVLLVRRTDTTNEKVLTPITFQKRDKYLLTTTSINTSYLKEVYYLLGNYIGIVPIPTTTATSNVTIHYVPEATDFTTDSSTSVLSDDWYDLLCYTAAIKGTDDLQIHAEQQRLWNEMLTTISDRQVQEPRYVHNMDED